MLGSQVAEHNRSGEDKSGMEQLVGTPQTAKSSDKPTPPSILQTGRLAFT